MNYFQKLTKKTNGGIFVIAEACDNHMGSIDIAKGLVDAAKKCGANAVKFQHHLPDEEMLPDSPMSSNFNEPLYDFLKRNALSLKDHYDLYKYCNKRNIIYLCTPFSLKAAQQISKLVPFIKIGSGEFQDHWLIDNLVKLKKPLLFSTGMCSQEELEENIKYLKSKNVEFALLNCLSEYPPDYNDMNLKIISLLKEKYPEIVIGHSDHSPEIFTSVAAVTVGAKIIEKHITLSKFIPGPDQDVSIEPAEMSQLVRVVKYIKKTMGGKKRINNKEHQIRKWAYRSVVARKIVKKGDIIKKDHLCTKRPGTGIPSKDYKKLIGKKAVKTISKNSMIRHKDLDD